MKTTRLAVTCCDFSKILSKKSAKRLDWSGNSKVITRPPVSLGSSKGLGYLMMKRSAREVLQVLPFLPNKFQIPIGFWSLPDVPSQRSKKHVCVTCVCVCAASSPLQFIYDYLTPGKHGAFSGVRCFFRSLHPVQLLVWHTGYLDVKNNAACDKQHDVWRAAQNKNPKMDHQRMISSWWFQPIWKICSSNWILFARIRVKTTKNMKPPPTFWCSEHGSSKNCLLFTGCSKLPNFQNPAKSLSCHGKKCTSISWDLLNSREELLGEMLA